MNQDDKLLVKKLLAANPQLRKYIQVGAWDNFWKELLAGDYYYACLFMEVFSETKIACNLKEIQPNVCNGREGHTEYKLHNLVIPKGVMKIGHNAFSWNSELINVELPSSLKVIGSYAFANNYKLESVRVPADCKISRGAFYNCTHLDPWQMILPIKYKDFKELSSIINGGTDAMYELDEIKYKKFESHVTWI